MLYGGVVRDSAIDESFRLRSPSAPNSTPRAFSYELSAFSWFENEIADW